jgi:hypothetical protein
MCERSSDDGDVGPGYARPKVSTELTMQNLTKPLGVAGISDMVADDLPVEHYWLVHLVL